MNNPFDYTPDEECAAAFAALVKHIGTLRKSSRPADIRFCRELEEGKMLGVMIAEDQQGVRHTLYAFSGQIGDGGFHYPGFAGPVFDYLQPDGYFKREEAEIIRLNKEIEDFQTGPVAEAGEVFLRQEERLDAEMEAYRRQCLKAKRARALRRASGEADAEELAAMIRRSQFEKAELHRMKKRNREILGPLRLRMEEARARLALLKEKRRSASESLQRWLFDSFKVMDANGESRSLSEIFATTSVGIPPSGAGECCAPKLLQEAYRRGWKPLSMAEYWYGKPKGGEVRLHGNHYPACRGKCLPVLGWMLRGMEVDPPLGEENLGTQTPEPKILFENDRFCIIDKPSGMLSVPGKGHALSLQEWLSEKYGAEKDVRMAHRLDRDTSGLMIATFGQENYRLMQSLFATRQVRKCYEALLDGDYRTLGLPPTGVIDLPLIPDWLDRPRQRVDRETGKEAVTEYEFIAASDGRSRILFHPLTGRTHQLRVHAASTLGLGMPITGDPLYGQAVEASATRLHLHARRLEFTFGGHPYIFESPTPF